MGRCSFLNYSLFVTFFPQLIAGPIVHHKEMLPQFSGEGTAKEQFSKRLAIGLCILSVGLFKKVIIADTFAMWSTPVFSSVERGVDVTFFEAWVGVLSYTFQIYFDFSGYSDMALGAARIFGIILPVNFHSPYKAQSIIEFWRRWHMTLSRFLKEYLYFSLGGNKHGATRRSINLMLTMVIGGIWHGAGWNFLLWGALHGSYLLVNHMWARKDYGALKNHMGYKFFASTITLMSVVVAWVFFRAATFDGAISFLKSMVGLNGIALPAKIGSILNGIIPIFNGSGLFSNDILLDTLLALVMIVLAFGFTLFLPNTNEVFRKFKPVYESDTLLQSSTNKILWRFDKKSLVACSLMFFIAILMIGRESEFLYFQF